MALLDTPLCDFGAPAPDFSLKTPDGKLVTLDDARGPKGLLVAFVCNHCPYVVAVAARLGEDAKALREMGLGVVAIMSNDYRDYPADAPERMQPFADKYGWDFPYLIDEDQSVGRAYGAVCTPDFFGYNAALGLQYRGRLDSAGMGDASGRVPDLLNAMRAVAETGEGPAEQTPSMGCSIKWSR
ncbi:AhpC/TSA family protein [Litoreibacter ponti]|uniref:AhpC/TSA family protein n=1 Tax=Litoreibacter ponti TaxID=1510457 RepID=A0A2T6BLQ5_9RHOB|nr:thioredoxin family protein [Litoreibacter ponti]PTX56989.1 AhpC/TSA family protein [Litoreibacter ponti]